MIKYSKPNLYSIFAENADAQCVDGSSAVVGGGCTTGPDYGLLSCSPTGAGNYDHCNTGGAAGSCPTVGLSPSTACFTGGEA